ncbi:MAG: hypothetical protein ACEY3A_03475, partial [Wolbachia sp.]
LRDVGRDIENVGVDMSTFRNRTLFKEAIEQAGFQDRKKNQELEKKWTQEEKEQHSQRMKEAWAQRKL